MPDGRRHQQDGSWDVVVLSPFGVPNARVAAAAADASALGLIDLGHDPDGGREALADALRRSRRSPGSVGVRVEAGSAWTPGDLVAVPGREALGAVLLGLGSRPEDVAAWRELCGATPDPGALLLAEVADVAAARSMVAAGADVVVGVGSEAAGAVGDLSTFVLVQALADAGLARGDGAPVPVLARGGVGPLGAAAVVVGGASGVVVDTQVALTREVSSAIPDELRRALQAMDGSETAVVDGYRCLLRPDLPSASPERAAGLPRGGTDLHGALVPVGQCAAFASALAARHRSVAGIVDAYRAAMATQPAAAARLDPFGPDAPLSASLGTEHAIAQGPMTRVSDTPEFACAVAEQGALPFLALALLRGTEVADLLERTATEMGDRSWGVGILGFVPPELREEQLAAIAEHPPPFALIAGGRPSQARPLEAHGTRVFLHVPSPGLLERFLADGARRFVFEGRECGGHVGPRNSFPLWESQLEVLRSFDRPEDLEVLFAGGIHDGRSAAMVAAMAAPLVEQGARIGVLMGTAYLFTEEAVRHGAIQPTFQDAAISTDGTVLLETSPGHATRCADSPYVRAFAEERARLEADGASTQEMWAALESLNLGRLRIASKGIRRDGEALASVPEDEQRAEGMFMLGQVAGLRHERTTVAELHASVSAGSGEVLSDFAHEAAVTPAASTPRGGDRPRARIAIVGMAGAFAGADGLDRFWANVVGGEDLVTEVPGDRWDVERYYDPAATVQGAGRKTPSKWGGFLPPIPFDAMAFGIPPASLGSIEPVQLLALEVAARALADAGYGDRAFDRELVSVIFGAEAGTDLASTYGFRALFPTLLGELPPALDAVLPELDEDSFPGVLTNVIAGRIANRLDLGGVNYTVDAACAASLAALDMACKELAMGTSDMVLCGGADLHNGVNDYLLFAGVHALSPTGRCRSFDAEADGIALGEGVACVVLKRLEDARADGDRIYAVIEGIAGSSDGRSLGLTAPRPEGQRRALERAYRRSGIEPAAVGLVEAHGTGTVVGDRTELATLESVFGEADAAPGSIVLGSVKSQIGHTKCAAGLAGLIKTAYAIHRSVLPPTINVSSPNPAWNPGTSPFSICTTARPWASADRVAGVSAFGFGGTNFHAVLAADELAPVPRHGLEEWPSEIFLFRGDPAEVERRLERLGTVLGSLGTPEQVRLRDLAATVSEEGFGPVRLAIVADDVDDLAAKVAAARAGGEMRGVLRAPATGTDGAPGVAFLFPGQGSQRPGMLADLFVAFPQLQRHLLTGARWVEAMFPPTAFDDASRAAQKDAITDTRVAQPALGITALAVRDLLEWVGVRPDVLAGHSYGELAALAVAGALPEDELFELSEARGRAMLGAAGDDPGTMRAVAASADEVLAALEAAGVEDVSVANDNCPGQVVVSGTTPGIEAAAAAFAAAGLASRAIPVACAFHSRVVAAAADTFVDVLRERDVRPADAPVYANSTAMVYPGEPDAIRGLLAGQLASPVRFVDQIEAMYADGARVFVEAGPGRVLTGFVGKILGDRPHVAVGIESATGHGLTQFLHCLATLAVSGVDVDERWLFEGRARVIDLSGLSARTGWFVDGQLVRTADGSPVAGGLLPAGAMDVSRAVGPLGPPASLPAPVAGDSRDGAMVAYLESMRQLVDAQRDAFLAYLGSEAPARPAHSAPRPAIDAAVAPAPAAAPSPVPASSAPVDRRGALVGLIAARTGYPEDMLGPDLDLEADLGIDSIKRLEILGELVERLGVERTGGEADDALVEQLVRCTTITSIVEWIDEHLPAASAPAPAAAPSPVPASSAPVDRRGALVGLIAARTGYPEDMLGPDLDLEADLGIDSIKRLEILGELVERLGVERTGGEADDALVEQLVRCTTITSIVEWIDEHLPAASAPASSREAVAGTAPAGPAAPAGAALLGLLTAAVAARTGYPEDMLGPDLDLEADLGIDSIKRLEILGDLAESLGLAAGADAERDGLVESLVACKTLRAVVDWIDGRGSAATSGGASGSDDPGSPAPDLPERALRSTFAIVPCPLESREAASLEDARVAVAGVGPLADLTAAALEVRGARVTRCDGLSDLDSRVDGIVDLGALDGRGSVPAHFDALRAHALDGVRWICSVTALGGSGGRVAPAGGASPLELLDRGAGRAGFAKALARELPDVVVRCVDLDEPALGATDAGEWIATELEHPGGPVAVGYRSGVRVRVEALEGERPEAPAAVPELTDESVVLLTGGARGVTALVAVDLARRHRCRIELVGRSPLPDAPEDPATAAATDDVALRKALIAQGLREPAAIESARARILAEREIRATVGRLEDAGVKVSYHAADVRDAAAMARVVEDVLGRHGRIDLVVHGAGVIEDRVLADKTPDSFRRVWDTKVEGARALLGALGDARPALVFFTSVSGAFGNRGQVDYAAANDALATLAHALAPHWPARVCAVDWGPWSGAGMVSAELEREYERRGVGLLDPDDAIAGMVAELALGEDGAPVEVVYARAPVAVFAAERTGA